MTDVVDAATRSRMMSAIRGKDTLPELRVRAYLHDAGLRFRANDRRYPGTPDIVLPAHRVVVFVHGCFWHRHPGCRFATTPADRAEFWQGKFNANVARDQAKVSALEELGFKVITIWECQTRDPDELDKLYWSIRAASSMT